MFLLGKTTPKPDVRGGVGVDDRLMREPRLMVPRMLPISGVWKLNGNHPIISKNASNVLAFVPTLFGRTHFVNIVGAVGAFNFYNGTTDPTFGSIGNNIGYSCNATTNKSLHFTRPSSPASTASTIFVAAFWDGSSPAGNAAPFAAYGDWYDNSSNVRQNSIGFGFQSGGNNICATQKSAFGTGVPMPVGVLFPCVMTRTSTSCVAYYGDGTVESFTGPDTYGYPAGGSLCIGAGTSNRRIGVGCMFMLGVQQVVPEVYIKQFISDPAMFMIPA